MTNSNDRYQQAVQILNPYLNQRGVWLHVYHLCNAQQRAELPKQSIAEEDGLERLIPITTHRGNKK